MEKMLEEIQMNYINYKKNIYKLCMKKLGIKIKKFKLKNIIINKVKLNFKIMYYFIINILILIFKILHNLKIYI